MFRMMDQKACIILILAGLFCLTSSIMSLYSISTASWSFVGQFHIGLFQTCFTYQCIRNQYGNMNSIASSPPILIKRFFNAGPLAIVGIFIQLIVCSLCFLTAFIYLPPRPSLTCYLTPSLIFISFLFHFSTISEASHGIYLNGQSSIVYETALVLQVISLGLTIVAGERIHYISKIQYV